MKRSIDIKNASIGTYTVRATCPGCLPYVNTATFTAIGVGTELTCSSCTLNGASGRELRNPFKLRVLDKVTGEPVAGYGVAYSIISFTDKYGITISSAHPHGASLRVFNAVSDIYGFSRAYLKLGSEEGTYIVRARCETCLSGQEQIAEGIARRRHIIIEAKKTTLADPEDTPVVQITQVLLPNDSKSFTTASGENYVGLQAKLLPESLDQSLIRWTVTDDQEDFINSGTTQLQYAGGPSSGFSLLVGPGGVPDAATGRPLPLRYKIYAGANVPNKVVVSQPPRMVRQDEIDKCRQEYIDWGNGDLEKELGYAPRSKFAVGIAGDFGKYTDCYANIYPTQEAQVAFNLRSAGYSLNINSGYRSPRHNILTVQSSTSSPHLFGDAVDITPADTSPAGWQELWEAPVASCPKVLEYDKKKTILYCGSDGVIWKGSAFPKGNIPLNDIQVFSIQKNCIHLGKLKH